MGDMQEPMMWRMPAPPPAHVLSVWDTGGRKWTRTSSSGLFWADDEQAGPAHWYWLVYNRGPLTADELAR